MGRIAFLIDDKTKHRFRMFLMERGLDMSAVLRWCISLIIDGKIDLAELKDEPA